MIYLLRAAVLVAFPAIIVYFCAINAEPSAILDRSIGSWQYVGGELYNIILKKDGSSDYYLVTAPLGTGSLQKSAENHGYYVADFGTIKCSLGIYVTMFGGLEIIHPKDADIYNNHNNENCLFIYRKYSRVR